MEYLKARNGKSKVNKIRQHNTRSDYHIGYESVSSGQDTEELLVFEWSKVIPIYKAGNSEFAVYKAEIDTEHMKTETKGPRGRPLQKWDFLFSPAKFDNEIGLEQFNGESLPFEELKDQGLLATLVR